MRVTGRDHALGLRRRARAVVFRNFGTLGEETGYATHPFHATLGAFRSHAGGALAGVDQGSLATTFAARRRAPSCQGMSASWFRPMKKKLLPLRTSSLPQRVASSPSPSMGC